MLLSPGGVDNAETKAFVAASMDSSPRKPPRPSDRRPPKPSDRGSKSEKPALYKDRRAHRIELRQKISAYKEEINELKAIETTDEVKKAEIRESISALHIKLKECTIEKEAIENFNHTQFLNNLDASAKGKDRFTDEGTGNTRFFEHLQGSTASKDEESKSEPGDPCLQVNQADDTSPSKSRTNPTKETEASETSEKTKNPPAPVQLPPNTIV